MPTEPTSQGTPDALPLTPGGSFLEFLSVVSKHRKFISRFVLLTTVVTTVVMLLMPKWYKSTASVFPAEKADLFGALDGVSSLVKSFSPSRALSSLTGSSETDKYLAILKSATVLNAVIQKFDLVKVYDITSYPAEKTTKELLSNVDFNVESEGNLTISVYDKDPRRAADMANFFVEMLNKTNTELQVQNARGNRTFIEERYNKNLTDLAAAEDSLKAFQQRYGIIAMPEQTEASIKAGAEIAAQLALKEVELGVLRRTQSPDHPLAIGAEIEIDELNRKIKQMNSGTQGAESDMKILVPFYRVPQLGQTYIRRFRDVEIQYKILQFLTPMYEQAKVEERRQTPSVIVLDRAGPAERKSKPKISLYALIAFTASSLIACLVVFTREGLSRMKRMQPDRYESVMSSLRSDWFGLRMWGKP
ncbi:MAG: GumC family protein [Bacteroidota bacterium]